MTSKHLRPGELLPRLRSAFHLGFLLSATSCRPIQSTPPPIDQFAYHLGTIGGFGELVNSGVKKLALSAVLPPAEMDRFLPEALQVSRVDSAGDRPVPRRRG